MKVFSVLPLGLASISSWIALGFQPLAAAERPAAGVPKAFVEVRTVVPDIVVDIRYFGRNNFLGRPVDGYTAPNCWITRPAAERLAKVQADLRPFGLSLKVFDAYRPQSAVNHFVRWAKEPDDEGLKKQYYPSVPKRMLIPEGYIADQSGHSRGSTIDLTIVDIDGDAQGRIGEELDMGTPFDFFGAESHTENPNLTAQQKANRLLLKTLMERHGFVNYPKEWWHFTLKDEPFPKTYFNFPTGGISSTPPQAKPSPQE